MENFEKREFIASHKKEIEPLLDDGEKILFDNNNESDVNTLLEKYETKLFYYETQEISSGAKNVLFSVNDTGAYGIVEPLIRSLKQDANCSGIGVLASGPARKSIETQFHGELEEVLNKKDKLLVDILEFSQSKQIDVVVGTVSVLNGPEGVVLYGGKKNLGAKKIFLIADGWGTLGSQFSSGNQSTLDDIDAILCADEFASKIFQRQLPEVPKELFEITGSPMLDSLQVENPEIFTRQAREKLSLNEDTIAVLYIGDVSADYEQEKYDSMVNEKTFTQTFNGFIKLAEINQDKQYALMFRPHPRDPNKEALLKEVDAMKFPKNMRVILAGREILSMQEARYAADAVLSIISTENFFASRMGRQTVFLGYRNGNLGGKALDQVFGQDLLGELLSTDSKMSVASSGDELAEILKNCRRAPQEVADFPKEYRSKGSIENIKKRILI